MLEFDIRKRTFILKWVTMSDLTMTLSSPTGHVSVLAGLPASGKSSHTELYSIRVFSFLMIKP
jgi:hypothetical protein